MKLSANTLEILKNYAHINDGISFKKGNLLRTVSPGKTIIAEAVIDETIPADFAVYSLNMLLSVISLSKEAPEMILRGNDVIFTGLEGRSTITYRCCEETNIKVPPAKNIEVVRKDATFLLTDKDLNWILRSAAVINAPNISIVGKDGQLTLNALNAHDDSAHTDTVQVGPYVGENFSFLFKRENWQMLPGTYAVTIDSKIAALFSNQTRKIQYWVALEKKSK